ncbi:uncharacterized protein LOC120768861 [Bactrocera tryoni]|uniref:uncharacterized protein LOC120768861 n=1 Tax=Bactrocera tryoni TaxID=59916 RepID=UPI001A974512|nr:uncharacterized protein LOC120768861 [Bactrocera tryoni]
MARPRFLTFEEMVNEVLDESEEDEDASDPDTEIESSSSESCLSEPDDIIVSSSVDDPLYIAKDGTTWRSEPYATGRLGRENVINLRPGVTRFASSRVNNIRDSFLLLFPSSLSKIIIENSNNYGKYLHGSNHLEIDEELFHAYLGILLLAGVYKSKNETLHDLFEEYCGRPIFRSIMSERTFLYIHKIIRFDDVLTRRGQRNDDKFAPIRNLWEKWSEQLPIFYNPIDCVTVDEQLLGFHGRCKFRQLQDVSSVCRNRVTSVEVEDFMRSGPQRPEPSVLFCNTHTCPPN